MGYNCSTIVQYSFFNGTVLTWHEIFFLEKQIIIKHSCLYGTEQTFHSVTTMKLVLSSMFLASLLGISNCAKRSVTTRVAFISPLLFQSHRPNDCKLFSSETTTAIRSASPSSTTTTTTKEGDDGVLSPWAKENIPDKKRGAARFRQHVNPLARKFQIPTELPENWPCDGTFHNTSLPLHIDIGCGKGGFLLDVATKATTTEMEKGEEEKRNYLGLEIRPSVVQYAQDRVDKWNLTGRLQFIGCNANVDLERLLSAYTNVGGGSVDLVSIQFPDPLFKKQHQKRRVVTPEFVETLAKYIPAGKQVFIQSDIKEVFDVMRTELREYSIYFEDTIHNFDETLETNPLGVPTEREISVLKQDLPVFRTLFTRTNMVYENND